MKSNIILIVTLMLSLQINAQFIDKLAKKAVKASERAVEQKVEKKSKKTTDEAVDKVFNDKKKSSGNSNGSKEVKSAKDFVAGTKVLASDDFSQDAIGDFPVNWVTNSSGEIVTISGMSQKWLQLSSKGTFTINDIKKLPDNFTFEFDVYATEKFSFYSTYLGIGFVETKTKNDYAKWGYYIHGKEGVTLQLRPVVAAEVKNMGTARIKIYSEGKEILKNEIEFPTFNNTNNNLAKVQIWRQKNRLRMYVNGQKIWDLPNAFQNINYNSVVFFINDYKTPDDKYYISNLQLAEAGADTRHQLIETGTFSTNEILFDVNKATIKISSTTILNDLGKALKENPTVKISITGHTDSDGSEIANQILSEQRSESVKDYLATNFSIDKGRMTTVGKGESEPVSENTSEEGKNQNRRVEFKIIK